MGATLFFFRGDGGLISIVFKLFFPHVHPHHRPCQLERHQPATGDPAMHHNSLNAALGLDLGAQPSRASANRLVFVFFLAPALC